MKTHSHVLNDNLINPEKLIVLCLKAIEQGHMFETGYGITNKATLKLSEAEYQYLKNEQPTSLEGIEIGVNPTYKFTIVERGMK